MESTITIEGKQFGRGRALFPSYRMPFPPERERSGEPLTLRGLITRVVLEEVQAFQERQEERRLIRALSAAEITQGAAKGKIEMGGHDAVQEVDADEAVATALLAFEDGLYYVFIDDEQQESLDREVVLKPDSRVTFLRLVALAGG